MIETHPTFTEKLSEDERRLIPLLISILQNHKGKDQALKCFALCDLMNKYIDSHLEQFKSKRFKMSRVRANKMINAIRISNLLPAVCGFESGYFIADSPEILRVNIKSLRRCFGPGSSNS